MNIKFHLLYTSTSLYCRLRLEHLLRALAEMVQRCSVICPATDINLTITSALVMVTDLITDLICTRRCQVCSYSTSRSKFYMALQLLEFYIWLCYCFSAHTTISSLVLRLVRVFVYVAVSFHIVIRNIHTLIQQDSGVSVQNSDASVPKITIRHVYELRYCMTALLSKGASFIRCFLTNSIKMREFLL